MKGRGQNKWSLRFYQVYAWLVLTHGLPHRLWAGSSRRALPTVTEVPSALMTSAWSSRRVLVWILHSRGQILSPACAISPWYILPLSPFWVTQLKISSQESQMQNEDSLAQSDAFVLSWATPPGKDAFAFLSSLDPSLHRKWRASSFEPRKDLQSSHSGSHCLCSGEQIGLGLSVSLYLVQTCSCSLRNNNDNHIYFHERNNFNFSKYIILLFHFYNMSV